jgi:hypothetical protein
MSAVAHLDTALAGLYASPPEPLPFAPSLHARAILLRRDAGNLLVYSATGLRSSAPAFDALGGVERQYLNHWHESMFASDRLEVTAPSKVSAPAEQVGQPAVYKGPNMKW